MTDPFEPKFRQKARLPVAAARPWSPPLRVLLLVYVAAFVIQFLPPADLFGSPVLTGAFALSLDEGVREPWRLFTFFLFHTSRDPYHFIVVFASLMVLFADLEQRLGRKRLGLLFTVAALGSGLLHLAGSAIFPSLLDPGVKTLGASGAAYGLLCAYIWPFRRAQVLGIIRGGVLAPFLIGAIFLSGCWSHEGGIEYRAQAAGLLLGSSILLVPPRLSILTARWATARQVRGIIRDSEVAVRVDELLGKISSEGMGALTRRERRFLKKASGRFKKASPDEDSPAG